MELTIDGIGKVCDTRILLEGITLVAGPNNIGKSTIGKTLFALVNSQYDFTARMLREKISKTEQAIYRYLSAKEKLSYQLVDYLSGTIASRLVKDLAAPAGTTSMKVGEWFTSQGRRFEDDQLEREEIEETRRMLLAMGTGREEQGRALCAQCTSIVNDEAPSYRRLFMEKQFRHAVRRSNQQPPRVRTGRDGGPFQPYGTTERQRRIPQRRVR